MSKRKITTNDQTQHNNDKKKKIGYTFIVQRRCFPNKHMIWDPKLRHDLFHCEQDPNGLWGKYRWKLITGTAVSKAINLNPFRNQSTQHYYMERKALSEKKIFTAEEIERMSRGTKLEPVAKMHYEKLMGRKVIVKGLAIDVDNPWLAHSGDGYVLRKNSEIDDVDSVYDKNAIGIIEIKCPNKKYDDIPVYYMIQMQVGMIVHNKKWCDFVVYIVTPDNEEHISITRVFKNDEYCNLIMVRLNYFMDCFDNNVLPKFNDPFLKKLTVKELPQVRTKELYNGIVK